MSKLGKKLIAAGQTYHEFNCRCDFCKAGDTRHPVTSDFPGDKRLAELEEKLADEYVGGMTEYWQRCKDFLLSKKGQEIADVLDGPEQECYPLVYVTDPTHGGKVTCHKCNGFIPEGDHVAYLDHQHRDDFPRAHFHKRCFNPHEHYDGLDKGID